MKKFLLMALAVVAIVSCKKNVGPDEPQGRVANMDQDKDAPIALSIAGSSGTKVGNKGVREIFEAGDEIGVYAALVDDQSANAPWWDGGVYFENKPATWEKQDETTGLENNSSFTWGDATVAPNLLENKQFYPSSNRSIYVYAYYPYAKEADTMSLDATTKHPTRLIHLFNGRVGTGLGPQKGDTVNKMQPDYMWAVGKSKPVGETPQPLDTVRRTVALDTLTFKHAMAQVQFSVYRADENATACYFKEITFTVPKKAKLDITDGKVTIDETSKTASDSVIYTVTAKGGEAIPAKADNDLTTSLPILDIPLMVFPMLQTQIQKCKMTITVDYGNGVDLEELQTKSVNLDQTAMKALNQGKKNIIYLGVGQTEILLSGKIVPWQDNDPADNSDIPVE